MALGKTLNFSFIKACTKIQNLTNICFVFLLNKILFTKSYEEGAAQFIF